MNALFNPGEIVMTRTIAEEVDSSYVSYFLRRHFQGDWGELDDHDLGVNEMALRHGGRLMSCYDCPQGKIWIITENHHSIKDAVTTVLRPEDY